MSDQSFRQCLADPAWAALVEERISHKQQPEQMQIELPNSKAGIILRNTVLAIFPPAESSGTAEVLIVVAVALARVFITGLMAIGRAPCILQALKGPGCSWTSIYQL